MKREVPGTRSAMTDKTERKKAPLAAWVTAAVGVALVLMLVIGILVL